MPRFVLGIISSQTNTMTRFYEKIKEVSMQREMKRQVLAVKMLLVMVLTVAVTRPSNVRAADGDYQLVENWAQLPLGMQWGVMSAVDIDSHGTIYAFKRSEPGEKAGEMSSMVMVLDPHGKFLRSWGEHTFSSAHGLRVLRDGFIWITDKTGDQVFKFGPDGELLMTLGKKGVAGDNNSTDALNGPSDVVIGKNGDIFVSDGESTNTRVVKFSKDGKFIKFWGTKGAGPGELNLPHNIAMDSEGRLYVADRTNKRIQVFDQDGKYLDQMTQFGAPAAIFITKDDMLYVVAGAPENRLTIGTKDGKVLSRVEGLNAPHWVAVDSSGSVYIAEVAGQALLKYVKK
jgi:6-bladed beta-propeller